MQKLERFHPEVKASLAPFILPVPLNDREIVEKSETHFKIIDQSLLKVCDEYEY